MKLYAKITKVDADKRLVYGYASTEALDSQGERISKAAIEAALPDYMKFANIREMHQPSAVGVAKEASIDDAGLFICVKVVDSDAWEKVKEEVYKGFSIGGKAGTKVDGVITSLTLTEISLVDRPANPECVFTMYKGEGLEPAKEDDMSKTDAGAKKPGNPAVDALASMVNKGEITPERLLELAKADMVSATPAKGEGEGGVAKADLVQDLKKYMGEEVWDAKMALGALDTIMNLLWNEFYEGEGAESQQVADLKAAVDRLKAFIAAEIMEDNSPDMIMLAEHATTLAKSGARNSKEDLERMDTIHKALCEMGYECCPVEKGAKPEDVAKVAEGEDLAKLAEGLKTDLAKAMDDLAKTNARLAALEAQPATAKGATKAPPSTVSKAQDAGATAGEPDLSKMSAEDRALEAIKKSHQQPQLMTLG